MTVRLPSPVARRLSGALVLFALPASSGCETIAGIRPLDHQEKSGVTGSSAAGDVNGGSSGITDTVSGDGGGGSSSADTLNGHGGSDAETVSGGGIGGGSPATGPVCGNGVLDGTDICDDGNATSGDGCSANCTVESGWVCTGAPSLCNRSCNGLAKTCGPNADGDCCASGLVPGGTFSRSYDVVEYMDPTYPATVSDFFLDDYEITVGRFRQFVAAYSQTMIPAGAGKNSHDAADTGWDATDWNALLPVDATALRASLSTCMRQAWPETAGTPAEESLPMYCIDWYQAEAFCIWDGGRLPTEAEWNYAASGGAEQRVYPWGSAPPDATLGAFSPATVFSVVGSTPAGNGKWGQSDLAGNVWEWVEDWYLSPYSGDDCVDCAYHRLTSNRALRGGSINNAPSLESSARSRFVPSFTDDDGCSQIDVCRYQSGARCARRAP
jgi:formylglycine-generating enzyme